MKRTDLAFFLGEDTIEIARGLLGKLLVVPDGKGELVTGMIVETEAYLGEVDRAAHSFGGRRTQRNEMTYAEGGHVYVFFIYGMYYQLNIVTGPLEHPHVVLIRAVEPIEGIDKMRERRGAMKDSNLTSGPGKLCIAFGIDRSLNGEHLDGSRIWIEDHKRVVNNEIVTSKRIGVDYAGADAELPLRFYVKGNSFVSRPRSSERRPI